MVSDAKNGTNEVAYNKPPQNFRFKKGRSGNPRGRPKGALNMATVLARILRKKVIIEENGKRKEVSKLEATIAGQESNVRRCSGHSVLVPTRQIGRRGVRRRAHGAALGGFR
jgi:hypothetical protein